MMVPWFVSLGDGSITPDHVMEDWPHWYQLVPAFVATYGSEELQELEDRAEFLGAIEEDEDDRVRGPSQSEDRFVANPHVARHVHGSQGEHVQAVSGATIRCMIVDSEFRHLPCRNRSRSTRFVSFTTTWLASGS